MRYKQDLHRLPDPRARIGDGSQGHLHCREVRSGYGIGIPAAVRANFLDSCVYPMQGNSTGCAWHFMWANQPCGDFAVRAVEAHRAAIFFEDISDRRDKRMMRAQDATLGAVEIVQGPLIPIRVEEQGVVRGIRNIRRMLWNPECRTQAVEHLAIEGARCLGGRRL